MKLLSVDWDFFFPNLVYYDWGHRENDIFINYLWQLRAGSRNLKTGQWAVDCVHPDMTIVRNFWDRAVTNFGRVKTLVVAESHLSLYNVLEEGNSSYDVDNYDAHHDFGYEAVDYIDCGNWAQYAVAKNLIQHYRLYYPEWRFRAPETLNQKQTISPIVDVQYGLPEKPGSYDAIFVCRSGAWIPSWADGHWQNFLDKLHMRIPSRTWSEKTILMSVDMVRRPTLPEAKELRDKHIEQMKALKITGPSMMSNKPIISPTRR